LNRRVNEPLGQFLDLSACNPLFGFTMKHAA
jgi:hypothetical protein